MSFLDRFAYVQELRRRIVQQDAEIAEMKSDAKKMIDCIASTKGVLLPFGGSRVPAEDWGVVRRTSIAREIMDLEAKHNTKHNDDEST